MPRKKPNKSIPYPFSWFQKWFSRRSYWPQNSRQAVISDFLTNRFLLHAVSQPLTNATLLIELTLQQQDSNSNYAKSQLRQALAQLKHLQALYKLSDETVSQDNQFNLQQSLNEVIHRHHQPQNSHILTPVFQLPNNPEVTGNLFLFQEALSCLINNAFESYHSPQKQKYVLLAAYEKKHQAIIFLGDAGSGVNFLVKNLMRIKGFTLKRTGHGLGTAYAKKILVDHLGGSCKLVSYPDLGTLYMISLPLKH